MTKKLTPFLLMGGNAKEAIHFYEDVLDAEIQAMAKFSDMPEEIEEGLGDRVAFSKLIIGESELMIADTGGSAIRSGNLKIIGII